MPRVRVPATTANLGPGFDTLGLALDLYNEVEVELASQAHIEIEGEGRDLLPLDESNMAYRAAVELFRRVEGKSPRFYIRLLNRIPIARGLGSSAAALVGALVGANALLDDPRPLEDLIMLAAELEGHPDNTTPAFIGGLVAVAVIENKVCWRRLPLPQGLHLIAVIPHFRLSTQEARSILPLQVPFKDAVFNLNRLALMLAASWEGDLKLMGQMMEDRLHQPYRLQLIPGAEEAIAAAKEAGALGVALSGSGPTLVALCHAPLPQVGEAMARAFIRQGITASIKILRPSPEGAAILE